ncbi:hypothetical protein D9615_005694 [Tricholomella constricta]|uniref:ribonuclease H n=1 Tax=Tricholomella constricta TaxID=117010 RepID=A0A8H5HAP4_9AGAR|nr:hypothetical protein D9615_005694 [Tricholomella constricta]
MDMTVNSLSKGTGIHGRNFAFCPTLASYDLDILIVECKGCSRFFAACCVHKSFGGVLTGRPCKTCHTFQLVFTDGACSNNGHVDAKSGLGFTIGRNEEYKWSLPVDKVMDGDHPRTSQRAELLAAIEGLKKLDKRHTDCLDACEANDGYQYTNHPDEIPHLIVVTDSEYVTKGMSEWVPEWRAHGWRNKQGKRPGNVDLFKKLDRTITNLEHAGIVVGLWHVPRESNRVADSLAKDAAHGLNAYIE